MSVLLTTMKTGMPQGRMLTGQEFMRSSSAGKGQPIGKQVAKMTGGAQQSAYALKPRKSGVRCAIQDDANDWLTQQLKEEADALKRFREMFGWSPYMNAAKRLKAEHEAIHEYERSKGIRR